MPPHRLVRSTARVVGVLGLGTLSVLHAIWAGGSPWPARSRQRLAELVVGQRAALPASGPTAAVSVCAGVAAVAAAGHLGGGRLTRMGLRALGVALLLRALVGGAPALAVLGLPPTGAAFRRADRRLYRPVAAVLGASLCVISSHA